MHDDFESGFYKTVQKSNKGTMTTQRLGSLYTEIYNILNQLNPGFMSNIFILSYLETIKRNQINFGEKSWRDGTTSHHIIKSFKL